MFEFSPPPPFFFFLSPLLSVFFLSLKHLNQALVLLHYYKNSPPISENPGFAPELVLVETRREAVSLDTSRFY